MKISLQGLKLLTEWEDLRLHPYDDKTGKTISIWCKGATIGVGHLILFSEWSKYRNGISKEEAIELLTIDIKRFERLVTDAVKVALRPEQFDALVIFCFNIGMRGFIKSSALRMINNPGVKTSYKTLEDAWKAWNKGRDENNIKVVIDGLVNRRNNEWELFLGGE